MDNNKSYSYARSRGIIDEKGEFPKQEKVRRLHSVAGKYNISKEECERQLILNDWDMWAAVNNLAHMRTGLLLYMDRHPEEVQMKLFHVPDDDDPNTKFIREHETAFKALDTGLKVGSEAIRIGAGIIGAIIFMAGVIAEGL